MLEAVNGAVQAAEGIQKERSEIVQELEKELSNEEIVGDLLEVI